MSLRYCEDCSISANCISGYNIKSDPASVETHLSRLAFCQRSSSPSLRHHQSRAYRGHCCHLKTPPRVLSGEHFVLGGLQIPYLDWVEGSLWPKAVGLSPLWNVVEDGNNAINGDVPDGFCSLECSKMEEFSGLGRGLSPCVNSFVPCCYCILSLAVEETSYRAKEMSRGAALGGKVEGKLIGQSEARLSAPHALTCSHAFVQLRARLHNFAIA
jgi:hypothetical protein